MFNSIQDFLDFTTESELDFTDKYLPTLDVKTRIGLDGRVSYRFFSKPTNNNLILECGTALGKDTVFSSLRQETVRRMTNTDRDSDIDTRIQILEEFIQLMVNSSHKFVFIKAVLLQGLSKYEHMVTRDQLPSDDVRHMPLHRDLQLTTQHILLVLGRIKNILFLTLINTGCGGGGHNHPSPSENRDFSALSVLV